MSNCRSWEDLVIDDQPDKMLAQANTNSDISFDLQTLSAYGTVFVNLQNTSFDRTRGGEKTPFLRCS